MEKPVEDAPPAKDADQLMSEKRTSRCSDPGEEAKKARTPEGPLAIASCSARVIACQERNCGKKIDWDSIKPGAATEMMEASKKCYECFIADLMEAQCTIVKKRK